jgi:hemerythrin-like domain-containing protein
MPIAIQIIKDEHRALGSVLSALRVISRKAIRGNATPDFRWLWTLIGYVDRYTERLHHPKKELYLFRPLEHRDPKAARIIARLRRDHAASAGYSLRMSDALLNWQRDDPKAGPLFAHVASDSARFNWRHMRLVEREILPAAHSAFIDLDWQKIDDAFASNEDPLARSRSRAECEMAL